jgi:flavodoxin
MKALVVYYTRSGTTRFAAEIICKQFDCDIEEIIDLKKRNGFLGFMRSGYDAVREKETKIQEARSSPQDYDIIFIGTPIWGGKMTPAIRTYLKHNDFCNKKLAFFCTMGGSENDTIFVRTKELAGNASFVGELALSQPSKNKDAVEKQIIEWCKTVLG